MSRHVASDKRPIILDMTIKISGAFMSHEGMTLVIRAALVIVLIVAAAYVRALVGRDRRRSSIVAVGTLGGMAFGVAAASMVSSWIHMLPRRVANCPTASSPHELTLCRRSVPSLLPPATP